MAGKALIVEDDTGVATLLSEVCAGLGLQVEHVRGGTEAIDRLQQALPDLVVCDVVLTDADGFQVATALRERPEGQKVPLLLVSGVYKKLPEGVAEKVRAAFLPKPFDLSTLRETLGRMLGAGDGSALMRGRFDARPASSLFAELCEKRSTGLLDVVARDVKRRVWFHGGALRFAQSNVKSESAGARLVAEGKLAAAAFDAALVHAKANKVPLHEALVATGGLSAENGQLALKQQVEDVAIGLLEMAGADWSFSATDPDKLPDAKLHALVVVMEHARRTLSPSDAREALEARGEARVSRTALLDRELFALRNAWPGETVTSHVGKVGLVDQLKRTRDEDLPLLWALVQSGLLQLGDATVDPRRDMAGGPAVAVAPGPTGVLIGGSRAPAAVARVAKAEDPDKGRKFSKEEQASRKMLKAEYERFERSSHYEALGVTEKAGVEEVKRAFLEAARKFHADAYSGQELGSVQPLLAALFARINEANEVLSDPKRREEYDIYLDRKRKGLPTDVAVVLQAEDTFQKGEKLANKHNKWADALPLFREAVALNPGEAEFHAYLGFAIFRVEGPASVELAKQSILKALAESDKLPSARYFLGVIAKESGDEATALKELNAALELDKRHEGATRLLREMRRSQEKREGGNGLMGLVGKLFGR